MHITEIKNHIPVYTWMDLSSPDEWETLEYSKRVALLPWSFHHVALMADGHKGIGCAIGSVIAMKEAISPSAVGSDIGCGMIALKFKNLKAGQLPDNLKPLRHIIERIIPVGFNSHSNMTSEAKTSSLWERFKDLDPKVQKLEARAKLQCGTLGSGNHFYELDIDTNENLWIMLHSGSRNIGKNLADIHINKAKKLIHNYDLPDPDLAVLLKNSLEFTNYVHDLKWAQEYALLNRQIMMNLSLRALEQYFGFKLEHEPAIQCHHNYVSEEVHFGEAVLITRKGAISARKGELGIIPGSQTTKSFIVKGLGNPDSFESASHGAGRRMSRGEAKRRYSESDLLATATKPFTIGTRTFQGVECRTDKGVLDEIEFAYKPVESIINNQKDLVEVVAELKQLLTVKG